MVQQIETIASAFARKPEALELAQDLQRLVEKHRGKSPETIEGIAVYEKRLEEDLYRHPRFDHYRLARRLVIAGEEKQLTSTENRLLSVLEERPNVLRRKTDLWEKTFGGGYPFANLKKYVSRLRQKIESKPNVPEIIISVHGQGYILRDPSREILTEPIQEVQEIEEVYSHPGFTYYPERKMVVAEGQENFLAAIEGKFLDLLTRHPNTPVPYERFIAISTGRERTGNPHVRIRTPIKKLREKIEPGRRGKGYRYISSVRGQGYRLNDPSKKKLFK